MYEIIEDCRPYYVKFVLPTAQAVIDYYNRTKFPDTGWRFVNHLYPLDQAKELLALAALPKKLDLNAKRVRLFCSKPWFEYPAHKDGLNMRFSLNVGVDIRDDKCVTSFYKDEDCDPYPRDPQLPDHRQTLGFIKEKHTPLKSMTLKQGEAVLLNTDIYHAWDNSQSDQLRVVLTMRDRDPRDCRLTFEQARQILFGL